MLLTVLAVLVTAIVCGAAGLEPGATLDKTTAEDARELLPPEILKHYQNGDYKNAVVDFPNTRWKWDDGFDVRTLRIQQGSPFAPPWWSIEIRVTLAQGGHRIALPTLTGTLPPTRFQMSKVPALVFFFEIASRSTTA